MKYKVVKNTEEFKGLKKDWDKLYKENQKHSVFQSFNFNYYSWKESLEKSDVNLSVVLVLKDAEIISLLPFYIDKHKRLRFINDIHSDFCDILNKVDIDFNNVIQHIQSEYKIKSVQLINLRKDSNLINTISSSNLVESEKYSVLELGKGIFPDNFSGYKSKQKTEFRRILKINKDKTHQILNSPVDEFPERNIDELRKKMIELGIRNDSFLPTSQVKLIKQLYQENLLSISVVKSDTSLNAISFILNDKSQKIIWIDMFDDSKMVNLFNYISLMSIFSGKDSVDINFGRGTYGYKISNFLPEIKSLYSIFLFSSKWQEFKFRFNNSVFSILKYLYKKLKK